MRALLPMLLGLCALLVAGCDRSPIVRYRMTIEVEADGQVHTGSSVWEFGLSKGFPQAYAAHFRGEAVAVDLPGRGTLFGLLVGRGKDGIPQNGAMEMLPENVYRRTGDTVAVEKRTANDRFETLRYLRQLKGKEVALDCGATLPVECPYLVRFRDIRDPKSVEAVDPANLAASFGEGMKLRRITIQITDDPVTTGIEKRLGWLGTSVQGYLDGQFAGGGPELSNILDTTAFKRGN